MKITIIRKISSIWKTYFFYLLKNILTAILYVQSFPHKDLSHKEMTASWLKNEKLLYSMCNTGKQPIFSYYDIFMAVIGHPAFSFGHLYTSKT